MNKQEWLRNEIQKEVVDIIVNTRENVKAFETVDNCTVSKKVVESMYVDIASKNLVKIAELYKEME